MPCLNWETPTTPAEHLWVLPWGLFWRRLGHEGFYHIDSKFIHQGIQNWNRLLWLVRSRGGWPRLEEGWLWRPLSVTLLCFLAAWGQQSPWSYALTSPQPETREPGPLNWIKINLPYLSHFLWCFVTATRTNTLLPRHQDPNRDSFSTGTMFRQREIQEWSH